MSSRGQTTDWLEEEDPEKLATALTGAIDILEGSQQETARRQSLLVDMELFLGVKLTDLYQLNGVDIGPNSMVNDQQIAFNICYSIPGTINNRICSFRPRAQFLPDGGDHKAQRAAREMTDMSDAWAQAEDYQFEAAFAQRDLLTGDGGVLKILIANDNPEAKTADVEIARFPSWEFYFDAAEGVYRAPECAYHVHYLTVETAARKYNLDEGELRRISTKKPIGITYVTNRDMVRVADAWLRGPDGRQVMMVGNKIVDDQKWEHDAFPLVVRTFDQRPIGMWGDGCVKRLRPLQYELIEWQNSMRGAHALTSQQVAQVRQDEDGPQKINNEIVRIERYKDTPATYINPAAANPEMYQYFELLESAGYKTIGVSQFIAAGTKQPGINSAVAIRESSELQTDRLALLSQQWETMRVEAAEWWRRLSSDLVKDGYKLKYRAIRRGSFVEMEMKREDAEREFEIRAFPSSLFGQTISGRLERATELIANQFLSKADAMKALDIPDLAPIVDLELAEVYAMEFIVDDILESNKYVTPDEQINPAAFYEYARRRYLLTISDGSNYPEENRASLRKLLQYLKPKAQASAAVAGGGPMAAATGGASPEQIAQEATAASAATPPTGANGVPAA